MNEQWHPQSGGLYLSVSSFDPSNPNHHEAALNIMRQTVQTVAKTHGASFSEAGLRKNMRVLLQKGMRLEFFNAKWELCNPKSVCVGATLGWNTFAIDNDGVIKPAVYTEDVCILPGSVRELIRQKPKGMKFPDKGLAESFEQIFLRNLMEQEGAAYRFGEVDLDNTQMLHSLYGNSAVVGGVSDSAVLEFERLPNDLLDKLPMNVELENLDDESFQTGWNEADHDIRLIVKKAHATALGHHRVDIRTWHNGNLLNGDVLECVLASSLRTIKQEVEERGWGDVCISTTSPVIPLLAMRPEAYAALYGACGTEILSHAMPAFGSPMPDAHIFIINDPIMLKAFKKLGAQPRLFGNKPMMPGVNILSAEPA